MNSTSAPTSPAIAKARLLLDALNHASTRGLSPTSHAVLAHLVADAWPEDDGWTAHTSQASLASRLNVHRATIVRALEELADIIDYRPGKGTRRSRYVISQRRAHAATVAAPMQQPSPRPRSDVPAPAQHPTPRRRSDIPGSGSSQQQQQEARAAADAADDVPLAQILDIIQRRPDWLPSEQPWLDHDAALALARLRPAWPRWCQVLHDARRSRHRLKNVAGFVLARLREQPAPLTLDGAPT